MRGVLWSSARLFAAAILSAAGLLGAAACGAPGQVEGIVERQGFFVRDDAPAARWSHDGQLLVVLAEDDGKDLRVVSLHLEGAASLPEGEPIALGEEGDGQPWIQVAWGPLEVTERSDGARIVSTDKPRFAEVAEGSVELSWLDGELQGNLRARLSDGGWLEGSFLVDVPAAP